MGFEGSEEPSRKLDWLDYTRFLAASAVMFFHYLANGPRQGKTGETVDFRILGRIAEYGYLGVDVFFLVSGFVIMFSAVGRRADEFAVSRAVRLWGTFVLCMTISAVVKNLWGTSDDQVDIVRYIANLTMVPELIGERAIDGVYWTLALELAFYGAVFFILLINQMHRIRAILAAWIFLLLAARVLANLFSISPPPFLGSYFDLFATGCVLALVRRNGWDRLLVALFVSGSLLMLEGVYARAAGLSDQGREISALVAMLTVAASLIPFLLFMKRGPDLPAARDAGRITYPLYLIHAHVGYVILSRMRLPPIVEVFLVAGLAIGTSWIIYRFFEEPTERFRRRASDILIGAPNSGVVPYRPKAPTSRVMMINGLETASGSLRNGSSACNCGNAHASSVRSMATRLVTKNSGGHHARCIEVSQVPALR